MDMPLYPGDPLTPGVGATEGRQAAATRPRRATLTKIPVLPISYGDAQPLLARSAGRSRRRAGAAALPITYHVGPGPAQVHLKLDVRLGPRAASTTSSRGSRAPAAGRVGRARQPPRRLGQRRRGPDLGHGRRCSRRRAPSATLLKQGWRPQAAPSSTPPGTARSRGCSARPSGPRPTPTSCGRKPWPTSTPTATARGFSGMAGSHALERSSTTWPATSTDPETGCQRLEALPAAANRATRRGRGAQGGARRGADLRIERARARAPTTRRSSQHLGIAVAQPRLRRRGRRRHLPLHLRRFPLVHALHRHRFVYGRALAQTVGTAAMRLAERRRAALRVHRPCRHGDALRG